MTHSVYMSHKALEKFGKKTTFAKHSLHSSPIFSDDNIARLLEIAPRDKLFAHTMGNDPYDHNNWINLKVPQMDGHELLNIIKNGKIWINLIDTHSFDRELGFLLDTLYSQISNQCSKFVPIAKRATLLLSSPNSHVFYHVDASPNLLWHIKGEKKLWVYPANNPKFISKENLEKIFTREMHEEVFFQKEFDQSAIQCLLKPGDMVCWPQNSPHRIVNENSYNISLNTEFYTLSSRRKEHVYCANRLLSKLGIENLSLNQDGVAPLLKTTLYRLIKKAKIIKPIYKKTLISGEVSNKGKDGFVLYNKDPSFNYKKAN